jgi:DNA polymerase
VTQTPAETLRDATGRLEFERAVVGRFRYGSAPVPAGEGVMSSVAAHVGEGAATPAGPSAPSSDVYDRIADLIPRESPLRTMASLEEIGEWLENTVLVPIDAARTRSVLGDGSPTADLMLIGEAPGADEDRQGLPFVGRAGQLLNQILAAIGLERGDVYITNVVKSRPPNNRDPMPEEVEAHLPILYRQISLVRPKLILALGRIAATTLLGRTASISSMRGTFHDYHGIPLLVTYHPAALLRDPKWKRPTWDDVQLLRSKYDELVGGGE